MLKRMFRGNGVDLLLAGIAMLAIGLLLPGSSVGGCVATCSNGCAACRGDCGASPCKCDKYDNPPEKCSTCGCRRVPNTADSCYCVNR